MIKEALIKKLEGDIEVAKAVVNEYFSPIKIKVTYLTRQA